MIVADTDTDAPNLSSLVVLDFDLALTQNQAMTAREFAERAGEMGLSIDAAGLESLHRTGVLFPLLGVDQAVVAVRRQARHLGVGLAEQFVRLKEGDLGIATSGCCLQHQDDGDVLDPNDHRLSTVGQAGAFLTWQSRGLRTSTRPGELLQLRHVLNMCPHNDPGVLERRARHQEFWRVILESLQREGRRFRRLCCYFRPWTAYVPQMKAGSSASSSPVSGRHTDGHRSAQGISQLGWQPDEVGREAEMLLGQASLFDPLAKWTDLVGLALPARRLELKGASSARRRIPQGGRSSAGMPRRPRGGRRG